MSKRIPAVGVFDSARRNRSFEEEKYRHGSRVEEKTKDKYQKKTDLRK